MARLAAVVVCIAAAVVVVAPIVAPVAVATFRRCTTWWNRRKEEEPEMVEAPAAPQQPQQHKVKKLTAASSRLALPMGCYRSKQPTSPHHYNTKKAPQRQQAAHQLALKAPKQHLPVVKMHANKPERAGKLQSPRCNKC